MEFRCESREERDGADGQRGPGLAKTRGVSGEHSWPEERPPPRTRGHRAGQGSENISV